MSITSQPQLPHSTPLLVLDTNVCLDLFVFHDPRWSALMTGLEIGTLRAITSESCRAEWLAVLHYPQLSVDDQSRPAIVAAFDRTIATRAGLAQRPIRLPLCNDKDDQKFMELARDAQATHLITKDKQLLKCARKLQQSGLFAILTPEMFLKNVKF